MTYYLKNIAQQSPPEENGKAPSSSREKTIKELTTI